MQYKCNADHSVLSRTINWKIWAYLLPSTVTDNKSSHICATLGMAVISWTGLGFIVFDNQRVSTDRCPHLSSRQMIGMPIAHLQQKIQNIYSWTTIYRKYRHVTSSSSSMEFHAISLDEEFIIWKSYFTWFCSALLTGCSDVCSAQAWSCL